MYAQLDNIIFEPINSPLSISSKQVANWAEHTLTEGVSNLQPTTVGRRDLNITVRFRREFIDIDAAKNRLYELMMTHSVCVLVWGNGSIEGEFVILEIGEDIEEQDDQGNIFGLTVALQLKEYIGFDSVERKRRAAIKNAPAVGSANPVIAPIQNPENGKKKVTGLITKLRRSLVKLQSLIPVADNDTVNKDISFTLNNAITANTELNTIAATLGSDTNNSEDFYSEGLKLDAELTELSNYVPVTSANIDSYKSQMKHVNTFGNSYMVLGMTITQQVITRQHHYQAAMPITTLSPASKIAVNRYISKGYVPDRYVRLAIDTLLDDLKGVSNPNYDTYDLISTGKIIALYPVLGGTAETHKFNLVDMRDNDEAFRLLYTNNPTHNADGILFNGTDQYADTQIQPASKLTMNQHHLFFYSNTNNQTANVSVMGADDGSNGSGITLDGDNVLLGGFINNKSNQSNTVIDSAKGFFMVGRNDANSIYLMDNENYSLHSNSTGSLSTGNITLGKIGASYGDKTCMCAGIINGEMLQVHAEALRAAVINFLTQIGKI